MITENFDCMLTSVKRTERLERKLNLHRGQIHHLMGIVQIEGFKEQYRRRHVTSYYFDDEDLSCVRDNIDGVSRRQKFRMRHYENDLSKFGLEIKLKVGSLGYKKTTHYNVYNSDIEYNLSIAAMYFKEECGKMLTPTARVKYDRRYFIHPSGVRCTFDFNIQTSQVGYRKHHGCKYMNFEVIEFKFPTHLDQFFRDVIWPSFNRYALRATKSSKYVRSFTN